MAHDDDDDEFYPGVHHDAVEMETAIRSVLRMSPEQVLRLRAALPRVAGPWEESEGGYWVRVMDGAADDIDVSVTLVDVNPMTRADSYLNPFLPYEAAAYDRESMSEPMPVPELTPPPVPLMDRVLRGSAAVLHRSLSAGSAHPDRPRIALDDTSVTLGFDWFFLVIDDASVDWVRVELRGGRSEDGRREFEGRELSAERAPLKLLPVYSEIRSRGGIKVTVRLVGADQRLRVSRVSFNYVNPVFGGGRGS